MGKLEQHITEQPLFDISVDTVDIFHEINRLNKIFDKKMRHVFHRDLSYGEYEILLALFKRKGALSPNQLMEMVNLTSGGITARLEKLENKKMIQRSMDKHDRRAITVTLLKTGEDCVASYRPLYEQVAVECLTHLKDKKTLLSLLKSI